MFVIDLVYKAPLSEIDAAMKAHMAYLQRGYDAGHFLVSGRKVPREGGVILALAENRAELEALVAQDPFVAQGLAEARITEFRASQRADDLQALLDNEPDAFGRRPGRR